MMKRHDFCLRAAGPHVALDGDMLLQFLYVPAHVQQRVFAAMIAHDRLQHVLGLNTVQQPVPPLQHLLGVLESVLPVF